MADGTAKRMSPDRQPQRVVSGAAYEDDARLDASVRPKTLAEYIGQKRVKENIAIALALCIAAHTKMKLIGSRSDK